MENDWVDDVRRFWFEALKPGAWFRTDPRVDGEIRDRFLGLYEQLKASPPEPADARTAVAAVVVLDQFPRNLFRDRPEAFASDAQALAVARLALAAGLDRGLPERERMFLYMPLQHSEDARDQQRSVELFATLAVPGARASAEKHKAIIDRFGRFPHRNAALGRASTPDEVLHLKRASGFRKGR
jgi:uncharacterized protein (DUF924 family)